MATMTSTAGPPRAWQALAAQYPELAAAYDGLSSACQHAGPLDDQIAALVKLAISVGGGCERTVHAHAKKALRAGVSADALRHVAMLALPTIGLPAALDARGWIEESIRESTEQSDV